MKNLKSLLFSAVGLLCSTSMSAHDFEVDGIYYNITSAEDKTVEVTSNDDDGIAGNDYSGTITIPESVVYDGTTYTVTAIGFCAFSSNSEMTAVTIPNSVTLIGQCAFQACDGLKEILIPNSVTYIGYWAFGQCSSLTSIFIPSTVTYIAGALTAGCSNLTSIIVDSNNPNYDSRDNCHAIIETETNKLISGCCNTIIPNAVTSIENYAFYYINKLVNITIPNNVKKIGSGAFYGCSDLKEITIPSSVTLIADDVFSYCTNLSKITVDEGNSTYDSRDNCNAIIETQTNTLYAGCYNTIIPNTVIAIGRYAFRGLDKLTSISIPSSVNCIWYEAFYNSGLTYLEIPNTITTIYDNAFAACYNLKTIISKFSMENMLGINSSVFDQVYKPECTLYVPYGAKETYATTEGWSEFTNIVEFYDLAVSNAGYATLYLDCAVEIPEGVEVYIAQAIEGDRLMMKLVEDGEIPANTGVLVKAPAGTYTFNYTETEVSEIANNLFSGSATAEYIDVPSNKTAFVLSSVDGNVGMYLAKLTDGQFLNNANKAYLLLSKDKLGISDEEVDTSIGGMQLSLRFDFNGSTGIDGVQTETSAQGAIYDLYGRKLQSATTPGLYIINGKKIWVK